MPLISIITITYNSSLTIENTLKSILNQTLNDFEYIIIDGNSTDDTLVIINKFKPDFEKKGVSFSILSEPDAGIGDAWNKGLKLAKGHTIGLLNADDMYHPKTLEIVSNHIENDNTPKVYYGICKFINDNQIVGENKKTFDFRKLIWGFGFTHTTCFVSKKVYEEVGAFNVNIKIAVDTEFLLRCYRSKIEFKQLKNITYMSLGGISDKKAKQAYFEYLETLDALGLENEQNLNKAKIIYSVYYPFRKIAKNETLRLFLRQFKHYLIFAFNIIYRFMPTFYLKNLFLRKFGMEIGQKSYIHNKVIFYKWSGLKIGKNTVLNSGCRIDNRKKITIGNNVSIAHNTQIYTCGHDVNSPYFDISGKEVMIDDYVCVFSNCLIMPGVRIGEGAVVYAGSVVTTSIPPYTIVGGNPAKKIGIRNSNLKYKLDYGFHKAL